MKRTRKRWKTSDKILFSVALIWIALTMGYLTYIRRWEDAHPDRYESAAIRKLSESGKTIREAAPLTLEVGKIAPAEVPDFHTIDYDNPWGVRLDPPKVAVTIDGVEREDLLGVVGTWGPDGRLDFDQESLSVISYDPTNGLRSRGDILCFFDK